MAKTKHYTDSDKMKTAFIRVHEENNTQDGLVSYSFDYIKEHVEDLAFRYDGLQYAFIVHDKDKDEDGATVARHYHIVIWFNIGTKNIRFKMLKEAFPHGSIKPCGSVNASVQYLVHKNDTSKYQYNKEDIITNVSQDDLDVLFVNDGKLEKKMNKLSEQKYLEDVINKIGEGVIRRYNQQDFIDIQLYSKYRTRIENAFKYQDMVFFGNPERNIKVIFIGGNETGVGKTEFAKRAFCDDVNGVCVSSTSNDPLQDYIDQDVLIFDDLRDNAFTFQDLLKALDPFNKSSIKSRYHNKMFKGKYIIITSFDPLKDWYKNISKEKKTQLYRRISKYYEVDRGEIRMYDIDKFCNLSNERVMKNPVPYITRQDNNEDDVFEKSFDKYKTNISKKMTEQAIEQYNIDELHRQDMERLERQYLDYLDEHPPF